MRKNILWIIIILLSFNIGNVSADDWHSLKSTHFIIYYKNAPEDFLQRLMEVSEDNYNKIADNLGFRRYNFWLWDNRAKIYIYDDSRDYQLGTGQPEWSMGCARTKEKTIFTFSYAEGFFQRVLLHEMGHIIFREFVGFDNSAVPLWLDEGVASYQEAIRYSLATAMVKQAMNNGDFMALEQLAAFNPESASDEKLIELFYLEAISIVNFLLKEFGKDNFVFFCQNLRDKKNLEKAISASYPFGNMQELEKAWQNYLLR